MRVLLPFFPACLATKSRTVGAPQPQLLPPPRSGSWRQDSVARPGAGHGRHARALPHSPGNRQDAQSGRQDHGPVDPATGRHRRLTLPALRQSDAGTRQGAAARKPVLPAHANAEGYVMSRLQRGTTEPEESPLDGATVRSARPRWNTVKNRASPRQPRAPLRPMTAEMLTDPCRRAQPLTAGRRWNGIQFP